MNYKKARLLFHKGEKFRGGKGKESYCQIPHWFMEIVWKNFCPNQQTILLLLAGTKGDGSFRPSSTWVQQITGLSPSVFFQHKAALVKNKYLIEEEGNLILDFDAIHTLSGCIGAHKKDKVRNNGGNTKPKETPIPVGHDPKPEPVKEKVEDNNGTPNIDGFTYGEFKSQSQIKDAVLSQYKEDFWQYKRNVKFLRDLIPEYRILILEKYCDDGCAIPDDDNTVQFADEYWYNIKTGEEIVPF